MRRYAVRKESGSRFAFVVDAHHNDERLYRYDVLKGDGFWQAQEMCRRMNDREERIAANKRQREE